MPLGSFRINSIAKRFAVTVVAEVIRRKVGITAIGNAQVSTAQSKFGGASALFAGGTQGTFNGDRLEIPYSTNWLGSTMTYEFWIRAGNNAQNPGLISFYSGTAGGFVLGWAEYDDTIKWLGSPNQTGVSARASTGTVAKDTWHHVAFVVNNGNVTAYLNGVQGSTGTFSPAAVADGSPLRIAQGTGINNGVWADINHFNGNLDEVRISNTARYTANFTAPSAPFVNDENTLLLIHANGTNATTFFEDDNGVRAPIGLAAGNNAKISTAQSKFGGSSIEFDGNDDFVTVSGLPSYANSNYTFECWARFDILPHNQTLGGGAYMLVNFASGNEYVLINRSGTGSQVAIQIAHAGNYGTFTKSGVNYAINTWYHIAVVRNSGVFKVFFNGIELTTFINDSGFTNSGRTQNISVSQLGKFSDSRGSWDGYMDEIRISNIARYTGDYTPPTAPHVNDANTQLLIHADGTNASTVFTDDNGVNGENWTGRTQLIPVSRNSSVVTSQSVFSGGSSFFGTASDSAVLVRPLTHTIGTGDFTIEGWFYRASGTAWATFFDMRFNDSNGQFWGIDGNNRFYYFVDGNGRFTGSTVFTTDTWYHVVISRQGSNMRFWINGVYQGVFADSRTLRQNIDIGNANFYYNNIRVSNSARYTGTSNISTPTQPFVNDANTILLLSGNEFKDNIGTGRTQKGIQAVGNAQVDTAQSKFGGASALFDGSGDRLEYNRTDNIGTGDFTFEAWVRRNGGNIPTVFADNISFYINNDNFIGYFSGLNRVGTQTITANVFNHVVWARESGTIRMWVNGVYAGDFANTVDMTNGLKFIGGYNDIYNYAGWIDEVRISNIARYTGTGNFTAPTAPFQNDANTLLLLHMDGTDASTVFRDDNGVTPTYYNT
jgi:hypothetical protein